MAGNSNIKFLWPWGYIWAVVALLAPGWMLGSRLAGDTTRQMQNGLILWIFLWIIVELIGVKVNAMHDDKGDNTEAVRTLSQLCQRIGQLKEDEPWWHMFLGWTGLITTYVGVLALVGGWAFWGIGPHIAAGSTNIYPASLMIGMGTALWLEMHFTRRYIFG